MIFAAIKIDYQDYIAREFEIYNLVDSKARSAAIVCPLCNSPVAMHGTYKRTVIFSEFEVRLITICQVRCKSCKRVHSVLPEFVAPNKQYSSIIINETLQGKAVLECAADDSTIRRWKTRN